MAVYNVVAALFHVFVEIEIYYILHLSCHTRCQLSLPIFKEAHCELMFTSVIALWSIWFHCCSSVHPSYHPSAVILGRRLFIPWPFETFSSIRVLKFAFGFQHRALFVSVRALILVGKASLGPSKLLILFFYGTPLSFGLQESRLGNFCIANESRGLYLNLSLFTQRWWPLPFNRRIFQPQSFCCPFLGLLLSTESCKHIVHIYRDKVNL